MYNPCMGYDTDDLMSAHEVADLKDVQPNAVRKAIKRGVLKGVVLFGIQLVHKDSAMKWEPVKDLAERQKRGGRPRKAKEE